MTVDDIVTTPRPPIRFLWGKFLPSGMVTLLVAYMKAGKSTFAYALMRAIAAGEDFLSFPTTKTKILILALEEPEELVIGRLIEYGYPGQEPKPLIRFGNLTEGDLPDLIETVRQDDIGLVCVDTYSRYHLSIVQDENDNAQVMRAIKPWVDFSHNGGPALLLIHHEGKAGKGLKAARGASALVGEVDVILQYSHLDRRGSKRKLLVDSRIGTAHDTRLEIDFEHTGDYAGAYSLTYKDQAGELALGTRRRVIAAVSTEWLSVSRIVEFTGLSELSVRRVLGDTPGLEVQGKGVKGSPLLYRLRPHADTPG